MAIRATDYRTDSGSVTMADTKSALHMWPGRFDQVHVDLGTGDGRFAIALARKRPETAVIGLDTNLDHLRGARKRHPGNVRFVREDALGWSPGMMPPADTVTINFPYGSLLRGLVEADAELLVRLDALLGEGGRLEIRVNKSALVATGLDPVGGPGAIVAGLRRMCGLRVDIRAMTQAELRELPTSWAKRLGFGRETSAFLVEGTRSG